MLLRVNYEKAFNRMEHSVCIQMLSRLGASDGSIALVRSFLEERSMPITIDGHRAPSVPLLRGSPQGSGLGCLLYCITTQLLTLDMRGDRAGEGGGPEAFLYVDDTTLFDVASMDRVVRHCSVARTVETFNDLQLGNDLDELSGRASAIGMKINEGKTQLLVISSPNGCTTVASFTTGEGTVVGSVNKLRLVGFILGIARTLGNTCKL